MEMYQNNISPTEEERLMDEIDLELSEQFTFDGFQVVRGEFFSHRREPSVSFADGRMYANAACVNKLDSAEYVQFLVNSETRKVVIRPCSEDDKDSFLWRRYDDKASRYRAKYITCRVFFAKIYELMNWNPDNRYKLLGKMIKSNEDFLFVFDLKDAEMYERYSRDGQVKRTRTPIFPAEWKNQFGLSVEEHSKQLQVNIFDGYAVLNVTTKEEKKEANDEWASQADQQSQSTQ